jgi:hypothetical protein
MCGAVATEHCPIHGISGELQMGEPEPKPKERIEIQVTASEVIQNEADFYKNHKKQ